MTAISFFFFSFTVVGQKHKNPRKYICNDVTSNGGWGEKKTTVANLLPIILPSACPQVLITACEHKVRWHLNAPTRRQAGIFKANPTPGQTQHAARLFFLLTHKSQVELCRKKIQKFTVFFSPKTFKAFLRACVCAKADAAPAVVCGNKQD